MKTHEQYTLYDYIKRFCNIHCIPLNSFAKNINYRDSYHLKNIKRPRLDKYFLMAEYMASVSKMPLPFYLFRLKQVIEGEYRCRD